MRILELTTYTAGICGVGARVKQEALELSKLGYQVEIFSSNFTKGNNQIAPSEDKVGNVKIKRFSAKKIGGESYTSWDFEAEALKFKPDLIIAHAYRHTHTKLASKVAKQTGAKLFLVTHAPFIENNSTRSFTSKIAVNFYDLFVGPKILKKFDKIIAITKWEYPYLKKLGVPQEKIVYIPNGIPNEFFKEKIKTFKGKKIVFLGRISDIKNLETLVKAFQSISLKNNNIKLKIIGPEEQPYANKIKDLANQSKSTIEFLPPIYDLKKKIKTLQETDIFVLPSKREAMPQALIEAMSLGKIVISSKTQGGKEIIENGSTGFLFDIGNEKDLASIIEFCLNKNNKKLIGKIQKNARKKSEDFKWSMLIKKLKNLIKK